MTRNTRMRSTSQAAALRRRSARFFDKGHSRNDLRSLRPMAWSVSYRALKPKREFLLEHGLSPQEISVMNTGKKRRKEKPT